jgi:hypothetical protein
LSLEPRSRRKSVVLSHRLRTRYGDLKTSRRRLFPARTRPRQHRNTALKSGHRLDREIGKRRPREWCRSHLGISCRPRLLNGKGQLTSNRSAPTSPQAPHVACKPKIRWLASSEHYVAQLRLLKALGLMPNTSRNLPLNVDRSPKPLSNAMSEIGSAVLMRRTAARRILMFKRYW